MDVINVINLFSAVQEAQKIANKTGITQTIKLKDYAVKTEKNTVTAPKEKNRKSSYKRIKTE